MSDTAPPLPSTISQQAREFVQMASQFGGMPEMPKHDADTQDWLDWVAGMDERMIMGLDARASKSPMEQTQFEIDGALTYVLTPESVTDSSSAPIYIDIHGGALTCGAGEACVLLAKVNIDLMELPVITWAPDYRMPPLHPYPVGLDDLVAVYRKALDEREPRDIMVHGSSAGGNLAAALLLRAKDEGLPMPAALVLATPEIDLTESGDSFITNDELDYGISSVMEANLLYANGHDLTDPYVSPIFGDLGGFPPTFLFTGTRDLLLSNTVLMHRALRRAGVAAWLHIWEAMAHGGFGGNSPEDQDMRREVTGFVRHHLRLT
ncbi:MAG: alpha/beta hydrolase fold domain-containing protein [bacterium]|nr:alpha/beta hydrolase fold domain-containing protein [bacterium]MCY4258612.1 alpha/beta hydrolase fold domain-containing protein [bacterium]